MLELIILRHAKAVAESDGPDRERHLKERGKNQALAQGEWLKAQNLMPTHILCSPAARTRETCAKLGEAWASLPPIDMVASLYAFGDGSPYIEAIMEMGGKSPRLMIIGHNPSVHSLAMRLASPENNTQALTQLRQKYPTCSLAHLRFDISDWSELTTGSGELITFREPGI